MLAYGGLVCAAALAVALSGAEPFVAIVAFGGVGLGLSNMVPVLFSVAARRSTLPPSIAISAVATAGYFGLLAGPALIGFVAEVASLRAALFLLVLVTLLIAAGARAAAREPAARVTAIA